MTDEERQRTLVDDELIRRRIRELADERPPESRWSRLSRHPMTTILFGFLLTWLVGTLLTNRIEDQRRAAERLAERDRQRNEESAAAVVRYAQLLSEHEIRARMLLSALERGVDGEALRARLQAYEDASVQWRSHRQPTLMTIRGSLRQRGYGDFDRVFDERLDGLYGRVERLLLDAYDARSAGAGAARLDSAEAMLAAAAHCGHAATDHLFQLLGAIADPLEGTLLGVEAGSTELLMIQCEPATPQPAPSPD